MSEENLQNAFTEYVKKKESDLSRIETKHSGSGPEDDCSKYLELLDFYRRFTDELKDHGVQSMDIINHLKEQLNSVKFDSSKDSSHTEDRAYADLEFLRRCLDNRVGLQERAVNALAELEQIIYSTLRENARLKDSEQTLAGKPIKDDVASNIIKTLSQENQELKQIIERNTQLKKMIQSKSAEKIDAGNRSPEVGSSNCEQEVAELKTKLAEKDAIIEELSTQVNDLNAVVVRVSPQESSESEGKDAADESNARRSGGKRIPRSRSDVARPSSSADSENLTDTERRDANLVKDLEKGYKELANILREKYEQLRKQRDKIKELMEQLEKCAQKEQEIVDLKDQMNKLRARNAQLEEDIKVMHASGRSVNEDIKKEAESAKTELDTCKEREKVLARKLVLQQEHLTIFMKERQNFIRMNNEMMHSIAVCQKELSQYVV